MILLKLMRGINKVFRATQSERIYTERLVKSRFVYEFRDF